MEQDILNRVATLERELQDLKEQYNRANNPSSQEFSKKLILRGGLSMNGASLGSSGDLMSVYGADPVARAAAISAPTAPSATYIQSEHTTNVLVLNNIRIALQNFGITL